MVRFLPVARVFLGIVVSSWTDSERAGVGRAGSGILELLRMERDVWFLDEVFSDPFLVLEICFSAIFAGDVLGSEDMCIENRCIENGLMRCKSRVVCWLELESWSDEVAESEATVQNDDRSTRSSNVESEESR